MADASDTHPMLAFLRGEREFLASYNYSQWMALCEQLAKNKLLICNARELSQLAPSPVIAKLSLAVKNHKAATLRRLDALERFADAAEGEHLRFAVVKGMAAAHELYGSWLARQSGDIDVLVAADDIPKADYAARKAGWVQPAESFRSLVHLFSAKKVPILQAEYSTPEEGVELIKALGKGSYFSRLP